MNAAFYISLVPVPLFYLVYLRHFHNYYRSTGGTPAYLKHLESFLYGVALALALILTAPVVNELLPMRSLAGEGFYRAALLEKAGAFLAVLVVQRHFLRFTLLEGVITGIMVGVGFSLVENGFYALRFGHSILMGRVLFSVPLHLVTCGMIGYFLGLSRLGGTGLFRLLNAAVAFFIPLFIHGMFDLFMMGGAGAIYAVSPLVVASMGVLELLIARAKMVPSRSALADEGLRLEEWLLRYRQSRYERWIQNSMGAANVTGHPLLRPVYGKGWLLGSLALIAAAAVLFPYRDPIIHFLGMALAPPERALLVSVFPLTLGLGSLMAGVLNPDFFRYSIMRIPVIIDAVLSGGPEEEDLVTFDISPAGGFLRTFEPVETRDERKIIFRARRMVSPSVGISVVWENHGELSDREPRGTIVRWKHTPVGFYLFIARYYLFRFVKGVVFNLKLPGFEGIRRLFMRPVTVMRTEVMYEPGAMVFRQGEEVDAFFYIKKGRVDIYRETESGERISLESLEAGQIFNEMSLLGQKTRKVTAQCPVRTILALAHPDNLEALIRFNPDFALALVRRLAERADQSQSALGQTVEYLQSILQQKESKTRTAAALMSVLLGGRVEGQEVHVSADTTRASGMTGAGPEAMLAYLRDALSLERENGGRKKTARRDTDSIEKTFGQLAVRVKLPPSE